jgi:hypothetical protein
MFTNTNSATTTLSLDSYNYFFINMFNAKTALSSAFSFSFYVNTVCEYLYFSLSFNLFPSSLFSVNTFFTALFNNLFICFDLSNISFLFSSAYTDLTGNTRLSSSLYQVQDTNSELADAKNTFLESSDSTRYNRFFNILVNYDYKTGHYIGNWEQQYPFLYTSFIEVARGIRKPSWFLSEKYVELLNSNYTKFCINFTGKANLKMSNVEEWYNSHIIPTDNFTNLYYLLKKDSKDSNLVGIRWVSFFKLWSKIPEYVY